MKNNQIPPQFMTHRFIFTALGVAIGLAWGLMIPGLGSLPIISGLLAGIYLSWMYKDRPIDINLTARIGAGLTLGLILGILPGMLLGTVLSTPFPDSFWPFFYLSGHVIGMSVASVGIAKGLIYWGDRD